MSSYFYNIDQDDINPSVNSYAQAVSVMSLLPTPLDAKLCNWFQIIDKIKIETIAEYLDRVKLVTDGVRTPATAVTMLLPKFGYEMLASYTLSELDAALINFDIKQYAFVGGFKDENFIDISLIRSMNLVTNAWHPDGFIFSSNPDNPNEISYTSGGINIHNWYSLSLAAIEAMGRENWNPQRLWIIHGDTITLASNVTYYVFIKCPIAEGETDAEIIITPSYLYEGYYDGYVTVLNGMINVSSDGKSRIFAFDWSNYSYAEKTQPIDPTEQEQWVPDGIGDYCAVDSDSDNTGIRMIHEHREVYDYSIPDWVDADPTNPANSRFKPTTNVTLCPIPLRVRHAYIRVGNGTFDEAIATEAEILPYSENEKIFINSPTLAGYNHIFISIPVDRYLEIGDDIGEISTFEKLVPLDSRTDCKSNNVYRDIESFATTKPCPLWVKIKTTP